MDGMTLRQISLEKNVSTGEISNIINAYRQGTPDLDELRKLHMVLGEARTRLPDALRGDEFLRTLDELEFDSKYLHRRNVNHIISKRLVAKAKDTGAAIVLENVKGIRGQTTVRKAQRRRHNSWSFNQLRQFIEYKAKLAGVPVIYVNPRGTSHTCPRCGA
jgi:IS605 OrfB family transposase